MSSDPEDSFHHPKDHFNRKWFSDPTAAAPILKVAVPDSLKPMVSPENLTLEPVSFIDKKLRATQSDLLWACSSEDDGEVIAYFYILWEHQSSVDHWMVLRLLLYMTRIWEQWLDRIASTKDAEEKRPHKKLPIVFPFVIYQGKRKWTAPTSLSELTRGNIPGDIQPYFPDFKFHLESISERPEDDFPPGLAQLGISVMKLMWDEDFTGWLSRVGDQLLELHESGQEDKVSVLLVYAFSQVGQTRREEFLEQIHENLSPMTASGEKSIYDSLIEEGMEKGLEKGLEKGMGILVQKMYQNGMTITAIAKATELSEEKVARLLNIEPDTNS